MYWTMLLGMATGLRTMTAVAVICWAARLRILPMEGTWAAWTGSAWAVGLFTLLALGEYYGDTRADAPSRASLVPGTARLVFGVLVGVLIATALDQPKIGGVLFGGFGALVGTFGGYRVRMTVSRWVGRDLPVALFESAFALGASMMAVHHIHLEIVKFAERAGL